MKFIVKIILICCTSFAIQAIEKDVTHLHIVGGGMLGGLQAYQEYKLALENNADLRVTIYEKNKSIAATTIANIVPSLTPDEILAVVPPASELEAKLAILFSNPGGIRVDDVENVNDGQVAQSFISAVRKFNEDQNAQSLRTESLLNLGKMSMQQWDEIYKNADPELKQIFIESNYNPCRERDTYKVELHDGYRIDLIFDVPNAKQQADSMASTYIELGYVASRVIGPNEVVNVDPSLRTFVENHTIIDNSKESKLWINDATALYRPGGCLDTSVFLPKLYAYLTEKMGTYTDSNGKKVHKFQILFDHKVTSVEYDQSSNTKSIAALQVNDGKSVIKAQSGINNIYVFCPGEALTTLQNLGFKVPAYSGFAGPSLRLNIPIASLKSKNYVNINHCMEVHKEGVVLAWQARVKGNDLFIGVGGTKAFYADQTPKLDHKFAKERNLLQLNMIANVYPDLIQEVFATIGMPIEANQSLTETHLNALVKQGIAKRWVGTRAVAYDGYPTIGKLFTTDGTSIANANVITHAGSGGGSFAPVLTHLNSLLMRDQKLSSSSTQLQQAAIYARSDREPKGNF